MYFICKKASPVLNGLRLLLLVAERANDLKQHYSLSFILLPVAATDRLIETMCPSSPSRLWPVYIALALALQATLTLTLTPADLTPGLDAIIDTYHESCPNLNRCTTTTDETEDEDSPGFESMPPVEESSNSATMFNNHSCCPTQCACEEFCLVQDNCCPDFHKIIIARNLNAGEFTLDDVQDIIESLTEEMKMELYFEQNEENREMLQDVDWDQAQSLWEKSVCMDVSISSATTNTPAESALYMVASCDPWYHTPDDQHAYGCTQIPTSNVQLSDITPVISYNTLITYKNKHCMICNEGGNVSQPLKAELQCSKYKNVQFPSMETFNDVVQFAKVQDDCSLIFQIGLYQPVNRCKIIHINSCNVTGLWTTFDHNIDKACSLYKSPVKAFIKQYSSHQLTFNNIACFTCNTVEGDTFSHVCETDERGNSSNTVTVSLYSEAMDFGYLPINGFKREHSFDYEDGPCENGQLYDKYMDKCRETICPRDHFIDGSYCMPMFEHMGGVTASLQLKLTLHSAFFMTMLAAMEEAIQQAIISYFHLQLHIGVCMSSIWRKYTDSEPIEVEYFFVYIALTTKDYLTYSNIWGSVNNLVNSESPFGQIIDLNNAPIKYDVAFADNFLLNFHHGLITKVTNLQNDDLEESDTNVEHFTNDCRVSLSITANSFCERVALNEEEYEIHDSALKLNLDQINHIYLYTYDLATDKRRAFICIHQFKDLQASKDTKEEKGVSVSKVTNLNINLATGGEPMQEDIQVPFFLGIIVTVFSVSCVFLGLHLLRHRCFPREQDSLQHVDMAAMGSTISSSERQDVESV